MPFFSEASQLVPFANLIAGFAFIALGGVGGYCLGKKTEYQRGYTDGRIAEKLSESFKKRS